jgi:ribonuclease P protein component
LNQHTLQSVDFERALRIPACARSEHFAVHYLYGYPAQRACVTKDDSLKPPKFSDITTKVPNTISFGTVVPKRYAKRAVTRNLIRREIRQLMFFYVRKSSYELRLKNGIWIIRLKEYIDKNKFPSACSEYLQSAIFFELNKLFIQVVNREYK